MQSLQKALPQLVQYTKKSDEEFKSQFINSMSEFLKSTHQSFNYFNKLGVAVRSYYVEENDTYSGPFLESVHFDIDTSAFADSNIAYSNAWIEQDMNIGNVTIFPMSFMLTIKKEGKSVFLEEDFHPVILSLNSMVYSVSDHVVGALCEYCDLTNFNIVFDCKSGSVDYGEY